MLALNCHRYVEIYYATSKLGAVAVPLNFRLSPGELVIRYQPFRRRGLFVDRH